jgi:SAM-dependent methyltransferase
LNRPLYTNFAWAYDLVVPSPAAPQPEETARLLAGRHTLVDVGCGTGRHAAFLAEAGFDVIGIDGSPHMIDVARARAPQLQFEVADLFTWRPPAPSDGVLCRGVLNEFVDEEERQHGLQALWEMLRDGGLLVISVRELEKTRARYNREPVVTRSAEGVFFRSEGRFLGDRLVIEETISSADSRADNELVMRPWTLTEVDERAAAAGFKRVERRIEGDRIVAACWR